LSLQEAKAASKRKRDLEDLGKSKRTKRDQDKLKNSPRAENTRPNGVVSDEPELDASGPLTLTKDDQKKGRTVTRGHDALPWKLSQPVGGRMLDIDPILTQDEQ
jgi:NET1-associated nuclear protein 1 (U3 small nucleolar RNA-associated protein 17)